MNHTPARPTSASRLRCSKRARNVRLRQNQRFARNSHKALIRTATGVGRKPPCGETGDVAADHSEIAGFEFKDIRAAVERFGLCTVRVRVGAEPFEKRDCFHTGQVVPIGTYPVNVVFAKNGLWQSLDPNWLVRQSSVSFVRNAKRLASP